MAAAAVCSKISLVEDFKYPQAKKLRHSPPLPTSAPSITCRKRSFVQDSDQFPSPAYKRVRHFDGNDDCAAKKIEDPDPTNGTEWVELLVKEMMAAASIDDARNRAGRVFVNLEKFISARVVPDAEAKSRGLEEKIEAMEKENSVLKRGIAIQHQRQKDNKDKNQEAKQLKELVGKYQEQLRTLQLNNYALTMHLERAQSCKPISDRCHPDVF